MRAPADIVALVEGAGDPAFAVDATRTIIAWNRAAEKLFSLPAAEVVGRNCSQIVAGRDARGRPVCNTLCPALLAIQRREPLGPMELQVDRRNGAPLWVAVSSIITTNGGPCVVHILRDITEEHHRKSFVQQVLQGAIALSSSDPDGPTDSAPVVLSPRQNYHPETPGLRRRHPGHRPDAGHQPGHRAQPHPADHGGPAGPQPAGGGRPGAAAAPAVTPPKRGREMGCPPDGGGPTPGVASKWAVRDIRPETPMTIEELLAKALYSERSVT